MLELRLRPKSTGSDRHQLRNTADPDPGKKQKT